MTLSFQDQIAITKQSPLAKEVFFFTDAGGV
jgi:hypothetical protein